jgi:inorganic pyrophosphatase
MSQLRDRSHVPARATSRPRSMDRPRWTDVRTVPGEMEATGTRPEISEVSVVVEIPRGSRNKYEFHEATGRLHLDRTLHSSVHYPADYGFLPETLADDGDHLDVLMVVEEPTFPGCVVPARVIGLLDMLDNGVSDQKVLAVPIGEPRFANVQELGDLSSHWLREIEAFFATYKLLEDKDTQVLGWQNRIVAWQVIERSRRAYAENEEFVRPAESTPAVLGVLDTHQSRESQEPHKMQEPQRAEGAQALPVRVYQGDDRIMIAAPMPGLEPDDISVTVAGSRVIVRGEQRGPGQAERDLLAAEWTIGPYFREVALPQEVDGARANATYGNGVLVLALPKVKAGQRSHPADFQLEVSQAPRGERIGHTGRARERTTTARTRLRREQAASSAS